jgi:hypothetical protein
MSAAQALTARDLKNKIFSSLPEEEAVDATVFEGKRGGYLILTEERVIEVYESSSAVWAQEQALSGEGWAPIEI